MITNYEYISDNNNSNNSNNNSNNNNNNNRNSNNTKIYLPNLLPFFMQQLFFCFSPT